MSQPDNKKVTVTNKIKSAFKFIGNMLTNLEHNAKNLNSDISVSAASANRAEESLTSEPMSIEELHSKFRRFSSKKIVEAVAKFYGFTPEELKERRRTKEIAFTRQIAAYLLRECNRESYPNVGEHLGSRDHSTMIHAHRKVKGVLEKSSDLRRQMGEILLLLADKISSETPDPEVPNVIVFGQEKTMESRRRRVVNLNASPETIAREKKILASYRSGKTLEQVGQEFKLTRERIRQLVLRGVFREIEERKAEGFEIDSEEYLRQEKVRRNKREISVPKQTEKETKRWSRFYSQCRNCGTIAIPHLRRGYCERCGGNLRSDRRERLIASKHGKCEKCGIGRQDAKFKYGRDFYITKLGGDAGALSVLCRGCFLDAAGERMLERRWGRKRR